MRTILLVKRIDFIGQVAAAAIPLLLSVLYSSYEILGLTYFIVGGVQLISCIAHWLFLDKFLRDKTRTAGEWVVGILLLLFAVCAVTVFLFPFYLLILFIVSHFLALWHLVISYKETRKISIYVDRRQYV